MHLSRPLLAAAALAALTVPLVAPAAAARPATVARSVPAGAPAAAPTPRGISVRVVTLHFATVVDRVHGSPGTPCDVVGDLYIPSTATRSHPVPAILTTNGFGGSKNDQVYLGEQFGRRGYVVLSYSGLGFGGSQCKIELDSPQWDGQAASQLIGFLGGQPGIGYLDAQHTRPYPAVDFVTRDHKRLPYDPRVGMIGGSYGGEVQFAAAADDPRLDTIVPVITWNDLSYSLAPNNTSFIRTPANPAAVTYHTPGTEKFDWTSLFFGVGFADGVTGLPEQPSRLVGCPNFDPRACPAKAQMDLLGYPDAQTLAFARQASVESYLGRVRIPTLLMQGQADTLFNLQESVATYQALRHDHVPVHLVWQSWGHSHSAPAAGELSTSPTADPLQTYEGTLIAAWFDRYLKGSTTARVGAPFQYYQDWQPTPSSGPDFAQYASAPAFPVVHRPTTFQLSGTHDLIRSGRVLAGSQTFLVPGGGVPTSYSETAALQGGALPDQATPPADAPGTFAAFESAPLPATVDQVGSPVLTVRLSAPSWALSQASGNPDGQLLLFVKLYDVKPDGTLTLPHRLIAPVRISDVNAPVRIELPALVHRYPAGDRLELVLAAGDAAYKNNVLGGPVQVRNDPAHPNTLTVPLLTPAGR